MKRMEKNVKFYDVAEFDDKWTFIIMKLDDEYVDYSDEIRSSSSSSSTYSYSSLSTNWLVSFANVMVSAVHAGKSIETIENVRNNIVLFL